MVGVWGTRDWTQMQTVEEAAGCVQSPNQEAEACTTKQGLGLAR